MCTVKLNLYVQISIIKRQDKQFFKEVYFLLSSFFLMSFRAAIAVGAIIVQ